MRAIVAMLMTVLMALSPVATVGQVVIFEDGFESGDTSPWPLPNLCARVHNMGDILTVAGLPNLLASNVVTVTAGAEGSDMLANNLKDMNNPTQLARLTSVFPHQSYWNFDFGAVPATKVRQVGLGNHTIRPGGQIRIITVDSGNLPNVRSQTLPPTAIEATVNSSGVVGDIDEHPSAHDGVDRGPSDEDLLWSIRVSFGTPSSVPAIGGNYQCFALWCSAVNLAGATDYPVVSASLYESGVLRASLGSKLITVLTGQVLIFPWNASDLQTSDGSGVELYLDFQPGALSSGRLDSISWEVLHQTDVDAADTDTGWHTIEGQEQEDLFGGTSVDEVDVPPALWTQYLDEESTVAKMRVEIRNDGMGFFDSFLRTPFHVPATFTDAGYALCNFIYTFPRNFMDGGELRHMFKYVGEDEVAIDGSQHIVIQYRWRECELDFEYIARTDAESLIKRLYASGSAQAFVLTLFPDDPLGHGTFLAVAQRIGSVVTSNMSSKNSQGALESTSRSFQLQFSEKLG